MKKIVAALITLMSLNAFAYEAIVIVLEAPLLKGPNLASKVLQTVRKGQKVYVPNEIGDMEDLPEFIQTYDRAGDIAYVPKKYIKLITHDDREEKMPISIGKHDPTDYRLEEPIPKTYPFDDTSFIRANVALSMGNNVKAPYDYNANLNEQKFSAESGARLTVTRKVTFDYYDRYYFGLFTAISTSNNNVKLQNSNVAKENRSILRAGPVITYDAFKNAAYRFTIGTGFTYNYHKSSIRLTSSAGDSEERLFSGFSLSPIANIMFQATDVFPNFDVIAGSDLNLYLPHTQKSKDQVTIAQLWGDTPSEINVGFKPQVSFFLGVQVRH